VSYLVEHNMADAREIAIAASQEFGAPLLDLDSISPTSTPSASSAKDPAQAPRAAAGEARQEAVHRDLDPTNLHALDEVKFATGFSIEAVVVEEDKLNKLLAVSLEQVDTSMPELAGDDFEMDGSKSPQATRGRCRDSDRQSTQWTMRRSSASSTRLCWTPSRKARRTSISSLTNAATYPAPLDAS